MNNRFYALMIVALFFFSCNWNGDRDLGNGYYYLPTHEASDMGYPYGSIVYRSEGIDQFANVLVYADIEKILHDDNYIVLVQKPNGILLQERIDDDADFWREKYAADRKDTTVSFLDQKVRLSWLFESGAEGKALDSLLSKSPLYKMLKENDKIYYFIDKRNGNIKSFTAKDKFDYFLHKNNVHLKL